MMEITHTMNCRTQQFAQQTQAFCMSYWYFKKCIPLNMFKMRNFWMYSINLGVPIRKGDVVGSFWRMYKIFLASAFAITSYSKYRNILY